MKRRMFPVVAAGMTLAASLTLPAGAEPAPRTASTAPSGQGRSPQAVWDKTCSRCHLTGVGPELRGRQLPPEYVRMVVRNGFLAMPAFPHSSIDDATLDGVARLVSTSKLPKPAAKR